jgi:DNA-binding Lrp family transcriptional regulator
MPGEWDDEELLRTTPETTGPTPRRNRAAPWLIAAALMAAAAVVMYVALGDWTTGEQPTPAAAPAASAPTVAATDVPLGGTPMSITVPPLDESDALVAELVKKLSQHPRVVAWLATKGLIRNFTAVVANIAEGKAPAALVPALRPSSRFSVIERGARVSIDPKSYERYTQLAEAVASIDPGGSATLYATLKPRIEEAYRDLGNAEPRFDRTLERAIVLLISTPVQEDPIAVKPKGIGYAFSDTRLENLTAAQKQLLRMGPQNARTIQRSLREIAMAIGIPSERLGDEP